MSETENLVLEHLRPFRGEIGKLSEKVDVFGLRISALESRFGALETRHSENSSADRANGFCMITTPVTGLQECYPQCYAKPTDKSGCELTH